MYPTLKRTHFMWLVLGLSIILGIYLIYDYLTNSESNALVLLSACSTYAVVLVTLVYAITTSEQRDVMADQLKEIQRDRNIQRLNREIDFVVGPLTSKIGSYKVYEPLYLEENGLEASTVFWEGIKKNLYLTSDDLRAKVDKYLAVFEQQKEQLRKVRYDIREHVISYSKENGIAERHINRYTILFTPAPINEGYNSYLQYIDDHNKEIGYDSSYGKSRAWFLELVNEDKKYNIRVDDITDSISIKEARNALEIAAKQRYDSIKTELTAIGHDEGSRNAGSG